MQLEQTYTSWNTERVSRHILYWVAWLLFYATVNSSYNDSSFWEWAQVELLIMLVKLPFTYFVIYLLVPRFLIKKEYLFFAVLALIAAYFGALCIEWFYRIIIKPIIFGVEAQGKTGKSIIYLILDLIYIASLSTVLKLLQRNVQQEKQTSQLIQEKLGAELTILKNQLHPHFLFNTLNNLYGMVLTQHPKAADVVVRLSTMMSYMLYECERPSIDLEKEIENLENYIELEKIRYGKRLDISFETGGNIAGKEIAPLLFIPFVENAFKHGIGKSERNEWIRINLWAKGDDLHFMIENSFSNQQVEEDLPKTQSGIGLKNVQKRLELLYPNQYQLEIKSAETFLVVVNLKLENEMSNS